MSQSELGRLQLWWRRSETLSLRIQLLIDPWNFAVWIQWNEMPRWPLERRIISQAISEPVGFLDSLSSLRPICINEIGLESWIFTRVSLETWPGSGFVLLCAVVCCRVESFACRSSVFIRQSVFPGDGRSGAGLHRRRSGWGLRLDLGLKECQPFPLEEGLFRSDYQRVASFKPQQHASTIAQSSAISCNCILFYDSFHSIFRLGWGRTI